MKQIYLDVTYREGRPYVAYLQLPSKPNEKRHKCRRVESGMILDVNKEGKLIGIELTAPTMVTLDAINNILNDYGMESIEESVLAPLLAA